MTLKAIIWGILLWFVKHRIIVFISSNNLDHIIEINDYSYVWEVFIVTLNGSLCTLNLEKPWLRMRIQCLLPGLPYRPAVLAFRCINQTSVLILEVSLSSFIHLASNWDNAYKQTITALFRILTLFIMWHGTERWKKSSAAW